MTPRVKLYASSFGALALVALLYTQLVFPAYNISPKTHKPKSHVALGGRPLDATFPQKIWQTSKVPAVLIEEGDRDVVKTWTDYNPTYRHEFLTAENGVGYVQRHFADEPEIVQTFNDLELPILRSDLLRYLVLLVDGGIYSDIDVKVMQPVDAWFPREWADKANVVVGIEIDTWKEGVWRLGFCTWTIMAKPSNKAMKQVVDHVIKNIQNLAQKQNTSVSRLKLEEGDIIATTGPRAFSDAIKEYLHERTGLNITQEVTGITESKLIDDVLILPIHAFGCGQAHSSAGDCTHDSAFVQHLFKGSWKGQHNS